MLRDRERQAGDAPRNESLRAALVSLTQAGESADGIVRRLSRLIVDLVFTAHPTEAKRRTTRRLIRGLRGSLTALHEGNLLPRERDRTVERMRGDLTVLYQIDLLRPQRPTVMQEVERGLFFVNELWKVVPEIDRELHTAAAEVLKRPDLPPRAFLRFGSWIGGDRDGNPFVTAAVTAETLRTLRRAAIDRHLATVRELYRVLVMTDRGVPIPAHVREATEAAARRWPDLTPILEATAEAERYRRWLRVIEFRLRKSREAEPGGPLPDGAYGTEGELLADLERIAAALRSHNGGPIADGYVADWLSQARTFGLHFAALDVRQDSRVHVEVLSDLLRRAGLCDDFADLDEPARRALLCDTLPTPGDAAAALTPADFEGMTRETLDLFRLLAGTVRAFGLAPLGGHVMRRHDPRRVGHAGGAVAARRDGAGTAVWGPLGGMHEWSKRTTLSDQGSRCCGSGHWRGRRSHAGRPHCRTCRSCRCSRRSRDLAERSADVLDVAADRPDLPAYLETTAGRADADGDGRLLRQHEGRRLPRGEPGGCTARRNGWRASPSGTACG